MQEKTLAKFEVRIVSNEDGYKSIIASIRFRSIDSAEMALFYFTIRTQLRRLEAQIDALEEDHVVPEAGLLGN